MPTTRTRRIVRRAVMALALRHGSVGTFARIATILVAVLTTTSFAGETRLTVPTVVALHSDMIVGVAASANGENVYSASNDRSVVKYDATSQREVWRHADTRELVAITQCEAQRAVVYLTDDGRLVRLREENGEIDCVIALKSHRNVAVVGLYVADAGESLVSADRSGAIIKSDFASGEQIALRAHADFGSPSLLSLSVATDGALLAGYSDNKLSIVRDGAIVEEHFVGAASIAISGGGVGGIAVSSEGRICVCGNTFGDVVSWDISGNTAKEISRWQAGASIRGVAYVTRDADVAIALADRIEVWNVGERRRVDRIDMGDDTVNAMAVASDCSVLVIGMLSGRVALSRVETTP